MPLKLIAHDAHFAVFNKPENQLCVPGKPPKHLDSTWQQVQQHHFPNALVVHRLDCATSGLMLFALNPTAQKELHTQFRERLVKKTYIALVEPSSAKNTDLLDRTLKGTIELPLSKDWPNRPKQKVDFRTGKPSTTHWQHIVEEDREATYQRIELTPITGRSHQLRMHMMLTGQPILGDNLYHPQPVLSTLERGLEPRLYLHAQTISFYHPINQRVINIKYLAPF